MRRIVLAIAQSLDGYTARADGSVDWLGEMSDYPGVTEAYQAFFAEVSDLIMGRRTFDQVLGFGEWPYAGATSHVLTHRDAAPHDAVAFTSETPARLVERLRTSGDGLIWLVGGTDVIRQFQHADLIDEYRVTTIPIVLGDGIPLFERNIPEARLSRLGSTTFGDAIETRYERRT